MNRPAGRFILRSRCAGSKGGTPACHDFSVAGSSQLSLFFCGLRGNFLAVAWERQSPDWRF